MKKLLSICFLSILLGLLSFSTRAQSSCGFVIKNLQPDTIHGVVQMAPDGELPLEHTLGSGVFINPQNPYDYYGNANVGATELYELFLCNTCGLDDKTKVSLDWILQRQNENGEWVNVNDQLSNYVDFDIYTLYRELNNMGVCNRITWLGGRVPNGFGCCEQAVAPDMFHGTTCNTPSNYPGALPVGQGTPYSVMNQLGELIPAMGMTPIYTEALDYFYLDFFSQTRTLFQLKWKQAGNYRLIVNLRERVGGTAWNNLTWNENETTDFIGGHQSCCGQILQSDTLSYPIFNEACMEVCQNETYDFGRPVYTFATTMADTNVVFGQTVNPGTACEVFQTDSIYRFHFYVRHTPQVVVLIPADTFCRCETFTNDNLDQMIAFDQEDLEYTTDHYFLWNHGTAANPDWQREHPNLNNTVGTHTYQVLQVNQYSTCGFDTLCTGDPVTLTITFVEIQVPTIEAQRLDFCLDEINANPTLTFNATSTPDSRCANTTRWYTKLNSKLLYEWIETLPNRRQLANIVKSTRIADQGNELVVNLADYVPSTNKDTVLYFFATSYDSVLDCESPYFSFIKVNLHQTPEIQMANIPAAVNCPGSTVTMGVSVTSNETEAPYNFKWNGDVTTVGTAPFVKDSVYTVGDASNNNSVYPFDNEKKYNYTQQIYEASEIGGTGEITKIAFGLKYNATIAKNNVKIYLGTTTESTFNTSTKQWFPVGTLVYEGSLNFTGTGWKEIELQHPFVYDGTENLVVTFDDQSGTAGDEARYYQNFKDYAVMRASSDYPITNSTSRFVNKNRNSMQFFMESAGYPSQNGQQSAQFQLPADCGASYMTTVYVIDANGCVSQPDTFRYAANDTIAPTIHIANQAALTTTQDACHVTAPAAYTTIAELAQIGVTVTDNCTLDSTLAAPTDVKTVGTCEETIVRTYTVADKCGNTSTFTQTFISHDNQAPYFEFAQGEFPYVRLYPVPAGHDCQYNSPDSMEFINAVAAHVRDNCTDSATLMQSVKFHWENTALPPAGESPIGATNIFRQKNHLTVAAVITDNCGNTADSLIIYIDKPDSIWIENQVTTLTGICQGASTTLTFNPALIHGDEHLGILTPLTYQWSVANGKTATFSDPTALTTTVTPEGSGDFIFVLTVTDANECTAVSGYYNLHVNPYPNVKIVANPHDGSVTPFCPTYGDVALQVVDKTSEQVVPGLTYVWSGENVDATSVDANSYVSIQPSKCTHDYVANVIATDNLNCSVPATITIHVADEEAPVLADGTLNDTVLEYQAGCKLRVPNFAPFMDGNVTDNCFLYANGGITYQQTPTAGTIISDAMWTEGYYTVTIKLTDACGNFSTYTVKALKPVNEPKLAIQASDDFVCENDADYMAHGITIVSNVTDGKAPFTYAWTEGISTAVVGTDANYNFYKTNGTYTFNLVVTDANGCTAAASTDVTIYYMGKGFTTREWPNTLCQGYNGALAIDTVPFGYSFLFQENGIPVLKSQDVPAHEQSPWNTVLYSPCAPGDWTLTIISPDGCQHDTLINIPNDPQGTPAPVATPHDVTNCLNNNGWIDVTMDAGYTYYLIDGNDTTVITTSEIHGLSASTYKIFRVDNATGCPSAAVEYTLGTQAPGPDFQIGNAQPNTRCVAPGNGSFDLLTPNLNYVVTLGATNIYEGTITAAYTIENLLEGSYHVTVTDPVTNCQNAGDITIVKMTADPVINASTTPNTYCDQTLGADGSITVAVASTVTYTVTNAAGVTVGTSNLWQGSYTINAVDNLGCTNTATVTVGSNPTTPTVTATPTMNMSCVPANANGTVTLNCNNVTVATYRLWTKGVAGDWVGPVEQATKTFTGLAAGDYQYQVVSNKGCESALGTTTVSQYVLAPMTLTSTDDYMCIPTATLAGTGSVKVTSPVSSTGHTFSYIMGTDTNTTGEFTNLAHNTYTVKAVEAESGCSVTGTKEVLWNSYTITLDSTVTPNTYCKAPYNGAVTLNFTTNNPNPSLTYKLNGDYQTSTTFEALQDGSYTGIVYDASVNCTYITPVVVNKLDNDLALNGQTQPNHGCTPALYDGSLSVTASSTTWTNPSYEFSFNSGAYATTSTWNNLQDGEYTVTVMEVNSGCTATKRFTVGSEGCFPIISDTAYNHNLNPNHWHFCLNTDNAYLEFAAQLPNGCDNQGFAYNWSLDCHSLTGTGNIIPVATDEVHCCTYTMTVTSLATGCTSELPVYVCIDAIPAIQFQINGADFNDVPRVKEICVNDGVNIGIKPNSWEHAVWTNGYHSVIDPTYNFDVAPNSTTPGIMKSFCVDVIDYNGCPNQGVISLLSKPLPTATVYDTACTVLPLVNHATSTMAYFTYDATHADADGYDRYEFIDTIFNGGVNGCDSITTHNITLFGTPSVTGTVNYAYCYGVTVADVMANYVIEHAIDTVITINGVERGLDYVIPFSNCVEVEMVVTVYSGKYNNANVCSASLTNNFIVNKAPAFTGNLVIEDEYCATGLPTAPINVPAHSDNICAPATATMHLYVTNTANINDVYADLGTVTGSTFTFIPRLAYDGKKLAITITSTCGSDVKFADLDVDSTVIKLTNTSPFCQDEAIDFDAMLGKHYDPSKVTAWLLYPVSATTPSTITMTTTYQPSSTFTTDATQLTHNGSVWYPINSYFHFTTNQNGGTSRPMYYTSNGGVIRLYRSNNATHNGNSMTIESLGTAMIKEVYCNATNHQPSPVTIAGVDAEVDGNTYYRTGLNATSVAIQNKTTNTDQLNVSSIEIKHTAPAPAATISGGYKKVQYMPGQELSMLENGVQIYFEVNDGPCAPVATDTITLTVNPKPTVAISGLDHDLCLDDAAADLTAAVTVQNAAADHQKWQYKASASATTYTDADNVNALVNEIKNMPEAQIAYHVWNDCGEATAYATVRILDKLTMSVTGSPVTVCEDATLNDVLGLVNVVANPGNYDASEVDVDFYAGSTPLSGTSVIYDYITSGGYITAIYHTLPGVKNCGQASATITVNFKSSTFTAPTYQEACDGEPLSAFIASNPSWSGSDAVTDEYWMVNDWNGSGYSDHRVDATYIIDYDKTPDVWYVFETECGHVEITAEYHLYQHINRAPEITNLALSLTTCAGGTVSEADANLTVQYHGNASAYTTKWTVDGATFNFSTPLTTAYDGKYLVVTIDDNGAACGSTSDSLVLHVNPNPTPEISGPAKACSGDNITFTATAGFVTYDFTINGDYSGKVVSGNAVSAYVFADGVEFVTAQVTVTDANGCSGTSALSDPVRVTDRPEFIFYNEDGTPNDEHVYSSQTGTGLNYGWMINTNCATDDKLVYVEFDYYYNGVKIADNTTIGQYLATQTQTDVYGNTYPYVTALTFSWLNGDQSPHQPNTSLYNYSIANPNVASAGNHFPNTNLGLSNTNVYDDLWMHFIGDRKVDVNIVPFRLNGEYKVVYRLYSTTHEDDFENLYYENSHHMDDNYYGQTLHLGGQNAFTNNPTLTLLISDSIIINVTGENMVPSTTPGETVTVMPEVAPELAMEEAVIVPDMEVWPNPAPAVTTTLKARVHNLAGNATVTLTTLGGKQVYNGNIYIENDNYYFEFDVNSLAVGTYVMTVRTATDVITKKVIVTSLAR